MEALWFSISASTGMHALAASVQGFLLTDLNWHDGVVLFAWAVALVKPGLIRDASGLTGFAMSDIFRKRRKRGFI